MSSNVACSRFKRENDEVVREMRAVVLKPLRSAKKVSGMLLCSLHCRRGLDTNRKLPSACSRLLCEPTHARFEPVLDGLRDAKAP